MPNQYQCSVNHFVPCSRGHAWQILSRIIIMAHGVVGGTASVISGGKFANGATTYVFLYTTTATF